MQPSKVEVRLTDGFGEVFEGITNITSAYGYLTLYKGDGITDENAVAQFSRWDYWRVLG